MASSSTLSNQPSIIIPSSDHLHLPHSHSHSNNLYFSSQPLWSDVFSSPFPPASIHSHSSRPLKGPSTVPDQPHDHDHDHNHNHNHDHDQDEMFELLCCSNELCLPFADHNGLVCDLPNCLSESPIPDQACSSECFPVCSGAASASVSVSASASTALANEPVPCQGPCPPACPAKTPDCDCCQAGCPPSPLSLEPCLDCTLQPSTLPGSPAQASSSSLHDSPASRPGCDALSEDIVWINKELEELIKCCCCDEPTQSDALPLHHADAHPSHHVNFNLFTNPASAVPPDPFQCHWQACSARFSSRLALAEHVNRAHLDSSPAESVPTSASETINSQLELLLVSCGLAPSPATCPDTTLAERQALAPLPTDYPRDEPSWIIADFPAGQDVESSAPSMAASWSDMGTSRPPEPFAHPHPHPHPHPCHETASTASERAPPETEREEAGVHLCRWQGCLGQSFATTALLTTHISEVHVGCGKSHYSCLWEGCGGSEEKASRKKFNQRQKVMRHLQTHTGDRPFVCETCGKRFGEMATLVQHGRTHTREKPYRCDVGNCGKEFSLQSALTIHKRTHSGDRPFKCPYEGCLARFGESSNLSKHLKVHSGVKRFICEECGRRFARSDQVGRHRRGGCCGGGGETSGAKGKVKKS